MFSPNKPASAQLANLQAASVVLGIATFLTLAGIHYADTRAEQGLPLKPASCQRVCGGKRKATARCQQKSQPQPHGADTQPGDAPPGQSQAEEVDPQPYFKPCSASHASAAPTAAGQQAATAAGQQAATAAGADNLLWCCVFCDTQVHWRPGSSHSKLKSHLRGCDEIPATLLEALNAEPKRKEGVLARAKRVKAWVQTVGGALDDMWSVWFFLSSWTTKARVRALLPCRSLLRCSVAHRGSPVCATLLAQASDYSLPVYAVYSVLFVVKTLLSGWKLFRQVQARDVLAKIVRSHRKAALITVGPGCGVAAGAIVSPAVLCSTWSLCWYSGRRWRCSLSCPCRHFVCVYDLQRTCSDSGPINSRCEPAAAVDCATPHDATLAVSQPQPGFHGPHSNSWCDCLVWQTPMALTSLVSKSLLAIVQRRKHVPMATDSPLFFLMALPIGFSVPLNLFGYFHRHVMPWNWDMMLIACAIVVGAVAAPIYCCRRNMAKYRDPRRRERFLLELGVCCVAGTALYMCAEVSQSVDSVCAIWPPSIVTWPLLASYVVIVAALCFVGAWVLMYAVRSGWIGPCCGGEGGHMELGAATESTPLVAAGGRAAPSLYGGPGPAAAVPPPPPVPHASGYVDPRHGHGNGAAVAVPAPIPAYSPVHPGAMQQPYNQQPYHQQAYNHQLAHPQPQGRQHPAHNQGSGQATVYGPSHTFYPNQQQ